jgi:hypothetical protein
MENLIRHYHKSYNPLSTAKTKPYFWLYQEAANQQRGILTTYIGSKVKLPATRFSVFIQESVDNDVEFHQPTVFSQVVLTTKQQKDNWQFINFINSLIKVNHDPNKCMSNY